MNFEKSWMKLKLSRILFWFTNIFTGLETIPGIQFLVVNLSPDGHISNAFSGISKALFVPAFRPSLETHNIALECANVSETFPVVIRSQTEKILSDGALEKRKQLNSLVSATSKRFLIPS